MTNYSSGYSSTLLQAAIPGPHTYTGTYNTGWFKRKRQYNSRNEKEKKNLKSNEVNTRLVDVLSASKRIGVIYYDVF